MCVSQEGVDIIQYETKTFFFLNIFNQNSFQFLQNFVSVFFFILRKTVTYFFFYEGRIKMGATAGLKSHRGLKCRQARPGHWIGYDITLNNYKQFHKTKIVIECVYKKIKNKNSQNITYSSVKTRKTKPGPLNWKLFSTVEPRSNNNYCWNLFFCCFVLVHGDQGLWIVV